MTRQMTTTARMAVRDTVIGSAAPIRPAWSQRLSRFPGGANLARLMASGNAIARTHANSSGCAAVAAGRFSPFRLSRSVADDWAVRPGMTMYFVASRPVKNCVMPRIAMAVAPITTRPSSFCSRSMVAMPSEAISRMPSQPQTRMTPRSAPFASRLGMACRLADTYVVMMAAANRMPAARMGWRPWAGASAGWSQVTR